jgi:hypothetical protein
VMDGCTLLVSRMRKKHRGRGNVLGWKAPPWSMIIRWFVLLFFGRYMQIHWTLK